MIVGRMCSARKTPSTDQTPSPNYPAGCGAAVSFTSRIVGRRFQREPHRRLRPTHPAYISALIVGRMCSARKTPSTDQTPSPNYPAGCAAAVSFTSRIVGRRFQREPRHLSRPTHPAYLFRPRLPRAEKFSVRTKFLRFVTQVGPQAAHSRTRLRRELQNFPGSLGRQNNELVSHFMVGDSLVT